ncbi:hypothetical protein K474DRAFT_1655983 [Panus rudis PR-1116 ss-1]|nr:hypothetical protein K474DRAFT_1655983 [Panus rudis PR-1116 ss-1]
MSADTKETPVVTVTDPPSPQDTSLSENEEFKTLLHSRVVGWKTKLPPELDPSEEKDLPPKYPESIDVLTDPSIKAFTVRNQWQFQFSAAEYRLWRNVKELHNLRKRWEDIDEYCVARDDELEQYEGQLKAVLARNLETQAKDVTSKDLVEAAKSKAIKASVVLEEPLPANVDDEKDNIVPIQSPPLSSQQAEQPGTIAEPEPTLTYTPRNSEKGANDAATAAQAPSVIAAASIPLPEDVDDIEHQPPVDFRNSSDYHVIESVPTPPTESTPLTGVTHSASATETDESALSFPETSWDATTASEFLEFMRATRDEAHAKRALCEASMRRLVLQNRIYSREMRRCQAGLEAVLDFIQRRAALDQDDTVKVDEKLATHGPLGKEKSKKKKKDASGESAPSTHSKLKFPRYCHHMEETFLFDLPEDCDNCKVIVEPNSKVLSKLSFVPVVDDAPEDSRRALWN